MTNSWTTNRGNVNLPPLHTIEYIFDPEIQFVENLFFKLKNVYIFLTCIHSFSFLLHIFFTLIVYPIMKFFGLFKFITFVLSFNFYIQEYYTQVEGGRGAHAISIQFVKVIMFYLFLIYEAMFFYHVFFNH